MLALARPSRTSSLRIADAGVGLAGEAEREAEVAVEREVGRVALQPLAVGRLRLGVPAEPVERDAARGDDLHVARPLGDGDVEVGERRLRLPGAELGAGELEQHGRILRLAAVRLVQRLLGAGVLAHAGIAAAEPDQRLDGVGVRPRRPGGRAPRRSGSRPRRPNAPRDGVDEPPLAPLKPPPEQAASSDRAATPAAKCPYRLWILAIATRLVLDLAGGSISFRLYFAKGFSVWVEKATKSPVARQRGQQRSADSARCESPLVLRVRRREAAARAQRTDNMEQSESCGGKPARCAYSAARPATRPKPGTIGEDLP